jgi:hypothetical protein
MQDIGRTPTQDPLTSEFPSMSPYCFFNNNPIYYTDPTGMSASPIYDELGTFLGTDSEGFKGEAIFMNRSTFNLLGGYNNGTDGSQKAGISHETAMAVGQTVGQVLDDGSNDSFTQRESDMINNAITHIVSQTTNTQFSVNDLTEGKTSTYFATANTSTYQGYDFYVKSSNGGMPQPINKQNNPASQGGKTMTFNLNSAALTGKEQFTVNNIQNAAVHEGNGHLKNNVPGEGVGHLKAYNMQINHSTWNGTTPQWKTAILNSINEIKKPK